LDGLCCPSGQLCSPVGACTLGPCADAGKPCDESTSVCCGTAIAYDCCKQKNGVCCGTSTGCCPEFTTCLPAGGCKATRSDGTFLFTPMTYGNSSRYN
jgi:hypothetical protein